MNPFCVPQETNYTDLYVTCEWGNPGVRLDDDDVVSGTHNIHSHLRGYSIGGAWRCGTDERSCEQEASHRGTLRP